MTPVSRASAAGRAYLDLQAKAKDEGRLTQELIQLYVIESFLARLAVSDHVEQLVLKTGALLAAFGTRRPTRDIDFAARAMDSDTEHLLGVVRDIAAGALNDDDGLVFDPGRVTAEVIREAEGYSGLRVSMTVELATARVRFHVDINSGDPIRPAPDRVEVPKLLGGAPITLVGYPLHMVHAEKIVTAVQRGTVNTRWRDFGDVWTLSRAHAVDGGQLQTAISKVASHRAARLSPLAELLQGYPAIAQAKWAAWRRKQKLGGIPADFGEMLQDLYAFADPALTGHVTDMTWNPSAREWQKHP